MNSSDKERGKHPAAAVVETNPLVRVRNGVDHWLRGLPGAGMAEHRVREVQQRALREMRYQLENMEAPLLPGETRERAGMLLLGDGEPDPARMLSALLEDAQSQTADEARAAYACYVFRQLVPDEARLLSAMQGGDDYPLLHVALGTASGPISRRLAENHSTVGQAASIRLPHYLPNYLGKLLALNLVDAGPQIDALEEQYRELETDPAITKLKQRAEKQSRLAVAFERRSIRISPLGHDLWAHFGPAPEAGKRRN